MDTRYQSGEMGVLQPIYTRGEDRKCCVLIGSFGTVTQSQGRPFSLGPREPPGDYTS